MLRAASYLPRARAALARARPASTLAHPPVAGSSLSYTQEERDIRDAASAFCDEHLPPARVLRMDEAAKYDADLVKGLHSAGFMGIEIPERHGGAGASFVASCLAIEEFSKRDASVAVMVDVQNTLVNNVFKKWGSAAVQDWALPRLATTDVGSFALSEPGSGSDAFALKTRAVKDGEDWVIDGGKIWITCVGVSPNSSAPQHANSAPPSLCPGPCRAGTARRRGYSSSLQTWTRARATAASRPSSRSAARPG